MLYFVIVIAAAEIAACSPPPPPINQTATLRLGTKDTVEAKRILSQFLFAERLIALDWNGRPQEALAKSWQWLDKGRTLEIELRSGVTFHDGTPLTAQVVVDILRKLKDRGRHNSAFDAVSRFEPANPLRLVIRLNKPNSFVLDAIADTLIIRPEKPDIGTGPFKLLARTPSIVAEKNASYYRGTPGIDRVEVIAYDTQRAAWVALMRSEVDMLHEVNRDSAQFLEGASQIEMSSVTRPFYIPLVFNVRHPILKNVEVRRALAEAIDRTEIVEQAMGGHGRVADDPVWPFHWAYNAAGARKYSYNPHAARVRLDAAGFTMRPAAAGRMASRFAIRCVFWNDPQWEHIALLLQRQLADIGVDLILEEADERRLQTLAAAGDFDTYLYQMTSGKSFDATYGFWHSPVPGGLTLQNSGYAGVDSTLDSLRIVRSEAEIRVAVADLRERFYDDVPAVFLAWPETTRAIDTKFDIGERTDPDVFANIWKWRQTEHQSASK
jgi:peptide/nickel transport system substrate-binding protein